MIICFIIVISNVQFQICVFLWKFSFFSRAHSLLFFLSFFWNHMIFHLNANIIITHVTIRTRNHWKLKFLLTFYHLSQIISLSHASFLNTFFFSELSKHSLFANINTFFNTYELSTIINDFNLWQYDSQFNHSSNFNIYSSSLLRFYRTRFYRIFDSQIFAIIMFFSSRVICSKSIMCHFTNVLSWA